MTFSDKLRQLIAKNQIKEVLNALNDAYIQANDKDGVNDITMIMGGISSIEKDNRMGTLSSESYRIALNQKIQGIIYHIDRVGRKYDGIVTYSHGDDYYAPTAQSNGPQNALNHISKLKKQYGFIPNNLELYATTIANHIKNAIDPAYDPQGTKWSAIQFKVDQLKPNLEKELAKIKLQVFDRVWPLLDEGKFADVVEAYNVLIQYGFSDNMTQRVLSATSAEPMPLFQSKEKMKEFLISWTGRAKPALEVEDLPDF